MPNASPDSRFSCPATMVQWLQASHWARTPAIFGLPPMLGLGGPTEIFDGLRALAEREAMPDVLADGQALSHDRLPACSDRDTNLEGYVARLRATASQSAITCRVDDFQTGSRALWFGCRPILRALYERVGMPAGGVSLRLHLRAGPNVPIAAYTDDRHLLCFVAAGAVELLGWSKAAMQAVAGQRETPHASGTATLRVDADLRRAATTMTARSGDWVYLPPGYWYAEDRGDAMHARLELQLAMHAPALADVEAATANTVPEYRFDPFVLGEQPDVVPDRIEILRETLADRAVMERLDETLVDRHSRLGFPQGPPYEPPAPAPSRLIPRGEGMLAWIVDDARLLVRCNGAGFDVDADPAVVALLETINEGRPLCVAVLQAHYCGADGIDPQDLRALLHCLAELGAFETTQDREDAYATAM